MPYSGKKLFCSLLLLLLCGWIMTGCASGSASSPSDDSHMSGPAGPEVSDWHGMEPTGHLNLEYATQFAADYYDCGALITVQDDRYLLIFEDKTIPSGLDPDIIVLKRPDTFYLAASSVMDYFRVLNALDKVRMTSTQTVNWSLPEVVRALEDEKMIYVGKYSAPDYELLLREGTDLAVESTMIYHSPETKEKIEKLGIPVLVDKSSYEEHPLGRMEWIKLYGLLLGMSEEAEAFYNTQLEALREIPEIREVLLPASDFSEESPDGEPSTLPQSTPSGQIPNLPDGTPSDSKTSDVPTVAYFYITSSGAANIRRPGDYISRMIGLSGGEYVFSNEVVSEESSQATMNMQMEAFLDEALKADVLIYSSSIDGGLNSLEDLYAKAPMLRESRAAGNGNIWITGKNMYQQTTAVAQMMLELHAIFTGNTDQMQMEFLHRLT